MSELKEFIITVIVALFVVSVYCYPMFVTGSMTKIADRLDRIADALEKEGKRQDGKDR